MGLRASVQVRCFSLGQALTLAQIRELKLTAKTNDAWEVAYCAEVLAANTGLRGIEIRRLQLGALDLENRRIRIYRKAAKTAVGRRLMELNNAATEAACRLYVRPQSLGATEPEHYLLPADLSRHTRKTDHLKGERGFTVQSHQVSWTTARRNLRNAALRSVQNMATQEERDLTAEERETTALFKKLRFHD